MVIHIFECNPQTPISTAYHLALACLRDRFPEDPQTCQDYGFDKTFTEEYRSNLLGLFQGLFNVGRIEPKVVHKWRVKGTLVENIKKYYEGLPAHARGGYYPWFLQNQWILDKTKHVPTEHLDDLATPGWIYAGGRGSDTPDDIQRITSLWPTNKIACFNLCRFLQAGWRPAPEQPLWVEFGFCVCRDERGERSVAALYKQLIARSTFNEFYHSYDTSGLIALFHAKGLGGALRNIPYLEDILRNSSIKKSVWHLKAFVMARDAKLILPAACDYGFFNCKTEDERAELKDVYTKYFQSFQANPIKLHEACLDGKLYEYGGGIVKLKKKFNRLMNTSYPLPPEDVSDGSTQALPRIDFVQIVELCMLAILFGTIFSFY